MTKLCWIRRRARRIMTAYALPFGQRARHLAVQSAFEDWQAFHPQATGKAREFKAPYWVVKGSERVLNVSVKQCPTELDARRKFAETFAGWPALRAFIIY